MRRSSSVCALRLARCSHHELVADARLRPNCAQPHMRLGDLRASEIRRRYCRSKRPCLCSSYQVTARKSPWCSVNIFGTGTERKRSPLSTEDESIRFCTFFPMPSAIPAGSEETSSRVQRSVNRGTISTARESIPAQAPLRLREPARLRVKNLLARSRWSHFAHGESRQFSHLACVGLQAVAVRY